MGLSHSDRVGIPSPSIERPVTNLAVAKFALASMESSGWFDKAGWTSKVRFSPILARVPTLAASISRTIVTASLLYSVCLNNTVSPIISTSILVRRKQSSASFGSHTTGSFSLNEVLSTIGMPVRSR